MKQKATLQSSKIIPLVSEQIIKGQNINDLRIRGLKANYKLTENTIDKTIIVRQYSNRKIKERDLVTTRVDGQSLHVNSSLGSKISFNFSFLSKRRSNNFIEISIPKDCLEHLKIKQNSGFLTFGDFNLKSFELNLGSGTIDGKTITSETIDVTTSSGIIEIDTLQGDGNIKMSSGINTFNQLDGEIDIKLTSG